MTRRLDDKGFTLTELMLAMVILAVGMLALAHLQIISIQGTSAARHFSTATNLAREVVESFKLPGMYIKAATDWTNLDDDLYDKTDTNNADAVFTPDIDLNTDIGTIIYDKIEVLRENTSTHKYEVLCVQDFPDNCDIQLADLKAGDFVRITNLRNQFYGSTTGPAGVDDADTAKLSVMKNINVIVMWKERNWTRHISVETVIGRKNNAFF